MSDVTRKRWRRWLTTATVLLLLFMLLRAFEYSQVYHPSRELDCRVGSVGIPGEEVWLKTADNIRLNAWFFPTARNSPHARYAVLFCHGNGGNISHRLDLYQLWHGLGVNFLALDYRGYGLSEGKPSEQGTYKDATAAYEWLCARGFAPENILVLGESLGGGVASWLAAEKQIGGLVLQSTYTSVPDLGKELFPWLPVKLLASIHYNTRERLPKIHVPVLFLHSRSDTLIRFHHAENNFAVANEPKKLHEVYGNHNDTLFTNPHAYQQGAADFLRSLAKK